MKRRKKILSLLLAGVLSVTPVMEVTAVELSGNDKVAAVETEMSTEVTTIVETEEVSTEVTTEVTTIVETETETTEIATEETTTEVVTEVATEAETTEVVTEAETTEVVTEEATTEATTMVETEEAITEVATEETTIAETETETTEIATIVETETETEEATTETETEQEILPGIKNYTLSKEQKNSLRALEGEMDNISNIREGVDCVEGELTFLADTEEEALKIAAGYGGELKSFEYGVGVITLPEGVGVAQALEYVTSYSDDLSEDVVMVPAWPNYYNYAFTEEAASYTEISLDDLTLREMSLGENSVQAISSNNNDPFLNTANSKYQWQHAVVGSHDAWNAGYTGKGVKVAVLDSGVVNKHEDLQVIASASFTAEDATDYHGHGTHVAGLIGAAKNNGKGGAGIAPDVSIISAKVLDKNGRGDTAGILRGINYAVSQNADIINMSLGGYFYEYNYETVVNNAYKSGVAVFAASGNDGADIAAFPAYFSNAVAIGATTPGNVRTAFSNYGSWVDFYAPGDNLFSTYLNGDYAQMSGTSQATPVCVGTAAVILSARPDIMEKTGKAKVDALVAAMNKGKKDGSIVSLPKALGIAASYEKPKAPVFQYKSGTTFNGLTEWVKITKSSSQNKLYYSVDGKNITYKNGVLSANAIEYTEPIYIGHVQKVIIKAIEINPAGVAGPVATATYKFKPTSLFQVKISCFKYLCKGTSVKMDVKYDPEYAVKKELEWEISPEGRGVTVSSKGVIKVAKDAEYGVYTVTARAKDKNSYANSSYSFIVNESHKVAKISYKKKSDTVYIGNSPVTYDLYAVTDMVMRDDTSFLPGPNMATWTTDNENIATVKDGIVTAKAAGKVKITAIANDGYGAKGTFTLTVKQSATRIDLSGSEVLSLGKSNKYTATFYPLNTSNKKLSWSVSPEDKGVTVSNGVVKASKTATLGKYTITAKTTDNGDNSVQVSKQITVTDSIIQKITLSNTKETIYRIKAHNDTKTSVNLVPDITASGSVKPTSYLSFTSSNPQVATVSFDGTVATVTATGKVAGTTKITCKALDGSNKSATCTVTVENPSSKMFISAPIGQEQFHEGYYAKGAKINLKANFENQYGKTNKIDVEWKSSNENVVSIDNNGKVNIKKENASVTITATASDGSAASFDIYTFNNYKQLSLDMPKHITMRANQYAAPSVLFDGKVSYGEYYPLVCVEVKDKDIIQVIPDYDYYGGYVYISPTGKKKGTTTFTIKSIDGTGKKATYKVTVK